MEDRTASTFEPHADSVEAPLVGDHAERPGLVRRRGHRLPALLATAYFLLIAAWVFGNPPGYTPDEPNHFVKAVGVGQFEFLGEPGKYGIGPGFGPRQLEWINQVARVFEMPAGINQTGGMYCALFKPDQTAACANGDHGPPGPSVALTYVGTYEPYMYFLPGLAAANLGNDAPAALLQGRVVSGLIAFALLALAVFVLWSPTAGGWSLLGLLAAVSPMVLFVASGLSPSGPEMGAAICFVAGLLRLTRSSHVPRRVWAALGAGGFVLVVSRSLGICYFALYVLLFAALSGGPRPAWRTLRRGGRAAAAAVSAIVVALIAELAWQVFVQPHPPLPLDRFAHVIRLTLHEMPRIWQENVGVFGWADVAMAPIFYPAWQWTVVAFTIVCALAAPPAGRRLIAAVALVALLGTLAIGFLSYGYFPLYGRYVLALWIMVPLVGGELLLRHRHRLGSQLPRWLPLVLAAIAGGVNFAGWWYNGQRYAVTEKGPLFFPPSAEWSPPLGWYPWIAATLVASAAIVAVGWSTSRQTDRAQTAAP